MSFRLQIDDSDVQSALKTALSEMDAGYEPTLQDAAGKIAEHIRENFLLRGGFDRNEWAALAPTTIRTRESRVKSGKLVLAADLDSPLIATGRLLRAATDATGQADGSAYEIDSHSVAVGVDDTEIDYAARAMGLTGGNIPVRDPIQLDARTESEIIDLFDAELSRRFAEI